jgi:hypothetical protein
MNKLHIVISAICILAGVAVSAQNKMKADTVYVKPTKDVEVTMEVPAQKGNTIYIQNSTRNIDIKTWSESKVKVVSTVAVEEDAKVGTGTEMFEKNGITLRSTSNRVELNAKPTTSHSGFGTTKGYSSINLLDGYTYYNTDIHALSPSATVIGRPTGAALKKRTLTIYVPEGVKLDIDNRSSDIIIRNDYKEAKFNLTSSNLDAQNIDELSLIAKYSVVNIGDMVDAQVEFENGTLRAMNVKQLDIDSKSSTIEYETGDNVYMRSQRDNYSIENIKKIEGRKQYGELRINKLHTLLDLEGNNADVKIRNIMENVEKIKLNNKYADVRLPIRNLQNYSVAFEGTYSTVFAPFEKTEIKEEKKETAVKTSKAVDEIVEVQGLERKALSDAAKGGSATSVYGGLPTARTRTVSGIYNTQPGGEISPAKFTASVGDSKGKKTKFELVCHSCTIDFK